MPAPLTQASLADAGCAGGCSHDHSQLLLHSHCHPSAGSQVIYTKATGLLTVRCRKCEKFTAEFLVAP